MTTARDSSGGRVAAAYSTLHKLRRHSRGVTEVVSRRRHHSRGVTAAASQLPTRSHARGGWDAVSSCMAQECRNGGWRSRACGPWTLDPGPTEVARGVRRMISGRAAEAGVWICGPWTESERMPTGLSWPELA